jgi:type VII secretion integral membrane protein EccD
MTTRFTRLSVLAGDQQLDASLPAGRPIVEYFDDIPAMLGVTGTSSGWTLSSPRHGALTLEDSLDEAGILDGEVLYLSPIVDAAEAPMVDDVITAVAAGVQRRGALWAGPARFVVGSVLLTGVGVVLTVALATVRNSPVAAALLLLLAGGAIAGASQLARASSRTVGWGVVPLALALGSYRLTDSAALDVRLVAAAAGALLGAAALGMLRPIRRALTIAGGTTALAAIGTALLLHAGVDGTAIAAWAAPGLVLLMAILPQAALTNSGLVAMIRQAEAGDSIVRTAIEQRIQRGTDLADGLAAMLGAAGVATATTLIGAGRAEQAALGGVVAAIFLMRSRGFTRAFQVGALLSVPTAAAVAVAWAGPGWLRIEAGAARSSAMIAALVVVAIGVAITSYVRLPEVPAARLSRLWDRLDPLAVLALIPMTLLAQNVFGWVAHQL